MAVQAKTHVTVTVPVEYGGEIVLQGEHPCPVVSLPATLHLTAESARVLARELVDAADKVGRHAALEEDE